PALGCTAPACALDEDTAHGLSGDGKEVRAVARTHPRVVDEPEIRLVDERRGLESIAGALAPHLSVCQASQFLIDQGHQVIKRGLVAIAPCVEQSGYLFRGWVRHL